MVNKNSKVLSVSHNDLDGIGCQILLANYFTNISFYNWSYYEIDERFPYINFDEYDYVIVSDISPTNHDLLKHPKIIYLDHHESAIDVHCPEENRFVNLSMCGTKIVFKWLDKNFDFDVEKFNTLVELVNDYDMWILSNPFSWDLNCLFQKYREKDFYERFLYGDLKFTPEEIEYIQSQKDIVDKTYSELECIDLPSINGVFFYATDWLNDLCHRKLKDGYNYAFCYNLKRNTISIRSNTELNLGVMLREIECGGGHKQASGTIQVSGDEIPKMVEKICERINMDSR